MPSRSEPAAPSPTFTEGAGTSQASQESSGTPEQGVDATAEIKNDESLAPPEHNDGSNPKASKHGSIQTTGKPFPRKHHWTPTHSFFVISGGFVFDTSDLPADEKFLPGSRDRVTLSPEAVLFVARWRPSLIPDISEAAIKDKSKADSLAKALACLQATWFIIQCTFRLAQKMPISLLELNTFAHAICALLIYCLWWNKPLDIEEPTVIDDKSMHDICAYLCMRSKFDGIVDRQRIGFKDPESGRLTSIDAFQEERRREMPLEIPQRATRLPKQTTTATGFIRNPQIWCWVSSSVCRDEWYEWYYPNDLRRWNLAYSGWKSVGSPDCKLDDTTFEDGLSKAQLLDRVPNWPTKTGFGEMMDEFMGLGKPFAVLRNRDSLTVLFAFTCAGLGYGSLHLLAWTAPFTSHPQTMLWRISAAAVAASGPVFVVLAVLSRYLIKTTGGNGKDPDPPDIPTSRWVAVAIIMVMGGSYTLFYLVARAYLVVECFISFAYLPEAIFQEPQWTYYFPHIT